MSAYQSDPFITRSHPIKETLITKKAKAEVLASAPALLLDRLLDLV
jgi:hypothetical protein